MQFKPKFVCLHLHAGKENDKIDLKEMRWVLLSHILHFDADRQNRQLGDWSETPINSCAHAHS